MKDAQDLANQNRGFEDTDLKLPDGCEKFLLSKYKSGEVIAVDFMPFVVGKGNPDCDEEWIYYRRVYWTHRLPTPKAPRGQEFCCDGVFGRGRCRVCRWLEKVNNAELAKECKRKTKLLWLLNDKPGTPPGEGNPWKVFKSGDFNRGMGFGEQMQAALKADVSLATQVGRKLFPPEEAELIADVVARDLPDADATISRAFVSGMLDFQQAVGLIDAPVPYEDVVATQFSQYWKP